MPHGAYKTCGVGGVGRLLFCVGEGGVVEDDAEDADIVFFETPGSIYFGDFTGFVGGA